MRLLKFLLPLAIFIGIGFFLYRGLDRDPSIVPSPLVGRDAPAFTLPVLGTDKTWSPDQFRGQVWLLNVWGSWCAACLIEHPLFNEAAARGTLTLVGLAWKDRPEASAQWLQQHGNPYAVVVSDTVGKVAIDYGVYGAPESFLIDKNGRIRYKQVGPFSAETFHNELLPLVERLRKE